MFYWKRNVWKASLVTYCVPADYDTGGQFTCDASGGVINSACHDTVIQIIIAKKVSNDLSHFLPLSCTSLPHVIIFVLASIDINDCASDPCRNGGNCTVRIVV